MGQMIKISFKFRRIRMKTFIRNQRLTMHILTAFVLFISILLASCGNNDRRASYYNQNRAAQMRQNNFPKYNGPLGRPRNPGGGMNSFMTQLLEAQLAASANSKDFGKTALIAAGVGGAAGIGVGVIAAIAASGGGKGSKLPPLGGLGCPSGVGCNGGAGSIAIGSPCPYAAQSGGPGVLVAGGGCMPQPGSGCQALGNLPGTWNNQGGCMVTFTPPPPPANPCEQAQLASGCPNASNTYVANLCPSVVMVPGEVGATPNSVGRGAGGNTIIVVGGQPSGSGAGSSTASGAGNITGGQSPSLGLLPTGIRSADKKLAKTEKEAQEQIAKARLADVRRAKTNPAERWNEVTKTRRAKEVANDIYLMTSLMRTYPSLNTKLNQDFVSDLTTEYKELSETLRAEP
jgi:hypothetical protein